MEFRTPHNARNQGDLPGINLQQGLERLGQNMELYRLLLSEFREEYAGAAVELQALIDTGDREGAMRYAHTIKGMAGNLSAVGIADAALELELAFKERAVEDYASFVRQFGAAINEFVSTAGRVEAMFTAKLDANTGELPERGDPTR